MGITTSTDADVSGIGITMNEELQVLKIITKGLNEVDIPYMITGSIAANYYTTPRMTRDIDIVLELQNTDIDKFVNFFQNDFYLDAEIIKKEVLQHGMFNLIHNEYVIKIDFIIPKKTGFQTIIFSRKRKVLVEDCQMWFIRAEDLILVKMLWAKDSYSEIQLNDVQNLIATVSNLDIKYIDKWVLQLNLEQVYRKVNR